MTLRLYFLGSPRVERDGQLIETDTRKAVALLAYLAVSGEFQSRDTLAALLWPEMSDKRARAALRRTLSSLRAAAGDGALYITRDGLSVIEGECWCDAVAFEAAVTAVNHHTHAATPCPDCLPKMEAAVSLYRDHFLSGFSLRDSIAFDDWQLATTEHLRRTYVTALAWLVQSYTQAGELDKAIEMGRRRLAADPLREEAHRRLMQLYAWNGAREAALRQYRDAVHILDEELGVGPLPETTALYEAIQEGRLTAPVSPPESMPVMPPAKPGGSPATGSPLIGRESAWADLLAVYHDITRAGRLAAITGETGIGKTRLVKEFLERARAEGAVTVTATCYEGEANLVYAPITAALRALLAHPTAHDRLSTISTPWLAEAARLVPELEMAQPARPESNTLVAQTRFFNGIGEVLGRLLGGNVPGVFFVDDVHWADDASLDLLAYLARRLNELPIMLILSWTDEKAGPSGDATRPRRLISEAQRAGTGRLIALPRWRPSDVLALVTTHSALRPRAAETTDRLYRETEGLPYFVIEYLKMLSEAPDKWGMPQSVHDLLAGRLTRVDQTGIQLLQTAAAIGRSFDYTTLLAASGRSEEEVIGGIESLLTGELIREITTGDKLTDELTYDFAHPQLRSLVYDEINLARRRLLHRRVAAALQSGAREQQGDAMTALIAGHYHLGGQDDVAADFYARAGRRAQALYANREALDHFQTALALGHPDAAALHEAIGDLCTLLGEYHAALQAYESAAAQSPEEALGRLEHKLGQVYERRGNRELAESHYCAALTHYEQRGEATNLARLNVDRSRIAYQSGEYLQARALAEAALASAEASADTAAQAQAHNTLGLLARQAEQAAEAKEHLLRSLTLAETAGQTAAQVAALNNLAGLLESEGQTGQALSLLDQALTLCTREGDRHREAALHNHLADILHHAGREEEAMTSLKQAVAIYAEIGMESGDWQPEIWKLTEW